MAFSSTIRKSVGLASGLRMTLGTWAGAEGDTGGSIKVTGGEVWLARFVSMDASGEWEDVPIIFTESAGVITITVRNLGDVTKGRFTIIHS